MYKDKDVDVVIFIKLFRQYLSEYIGFEVNKLSDAKKCMNKVKTKTPNYIREKGGALFCEKRYGKIFVFHKYSSVIYCFISHFFCYGSN